MKSTVTRQATLADLDALVELMDGYRQFYGQTSDPVAARRFLLDRFNHGESVIFLASQDGIPVGFTQLYPSFSSVSLARIFVLNDLYVNEQGRRNGVGRALISAAIEFAKTVGAVRLTLSTAVTNLSAQSLYSDMGWVKEDDFYFYRWATTA
ncbi:GNAT family N-acetyltransferase [Limnohabitans sp. 2KL-1]|uniref:GNAT family N-acetyltransferase n=1 Tax=Limnohabitans sp. 2KL-1 TaxID=1100699 RepID=UPI000D3C350C|nr:GNAT family N-acetyltransferase [Limnohabitans sp. 2KL-1]PUE50486.1 GNAT family N-acetyltransferase [Limnohabitans sp. 2KL-1]